MRYFNQSDIKSYKTISACESYNFSEAVSKTSQIDVFLSHSSKDRDALDGIVKFLEKYNVNVYLDKIDETLPMTTSPETGEKLKDRIHQSRKFIVLVSENSKDSKWIPWELGIADEHKSLKNVALLPISEYYFSIKWTNQEYFGIYDRITFGDLNGFSEPVWMVLNRHANTATELGKWLKAGSYTNVF